MNKQQERQDRGTVIAEWWRHNLADRERGRPRALAARLRRGAAIEALAEPEVHDLARRLGIGAQQADRLARLAQVLSEVRENDRQRLAQRLGGPEPTLSSLRFQRLLRASGDDFATALRRALPMVDRRCNVAALGRDLLVWDHPTVGDRIRVNWCFDYFGAPPPGTDAAPAKAEPATIAEETSA